MKRLIVPLIALLIVGGVAAYLYYGPSLNRTPIVVHPPRLKAPSKPEVAELPASDRVWTAGKDEIPVIMYHDVVPRKQVWFDLTTRAFEEQMQAIKDAGANVVPLSDVVEHLKSGKLLPPRPIALTFDDNTVGIYENAFPILRKFGFHSTQFVHTGKVGVKTEKGHCTWDQLREMQDSGLVEIGSHTVDHPADLRILTPDEVRRQLTDSKASIEKEMGKPCRYFAYTEGNGDEQTAQMVADAGYEAAWGEARAWDAAPADRLFLARFAPFRLEDILARWKGEDARPATLPAGTTVKIPTAAKVHTESPDGLPITLTNEVWAGIIPNPDNPDDLGGIIVPDMLFNATLAGKAPPERQWEWTGRPLVIGNPDHAYIVAYQPWIGVSPDGIKVLWPETSFAVVGSEQILHEGAPVEAAVWQRGRRLATFIGWKTDGTPVLGKTNHLCRREALISALQALGVKEAVLLGR
ncbi:MAG TPA: polysaccharide deacetylase family protein [Armatimonadota bacterium]